LAAQGLFVVGAPLRARLGSKIERAALICVIVASHGFAMKNIHHAYDPITRQTYELGLALASISQPFDLVVTVGNDIGDPGAIYYSHRRGWIFPPAWPRAVSPWQDINDESGAIALFDRLRSEGAEWFGIVTEQRMKLSKNVPRLLARIEATTELVAEDPDWAIYRISRKPVAR
jgi:hypothetical protein